MVLSRKFDKTSDKGGFSKLYLDSITANTDNEICAKRIDVNCENNMACTTLNVGNPQFFVSSWGNTEHSLSDDTVTITFVTYEKKVCRFEL